MQADLVYRYLSRIHGVFEHLSEINHERNRFELGRDESMRSMQLAIESVQQEFEQRSAKIGLIRGTVKKALESIPSHQDSKDSEPAGRDQSGDEEVDTELAEARLVSQEEALHQLRAKASERKKFFSSRRSDIQQSLDRVNSEIDKQVGILDYHKREICARFTADVSQKATSIDQNPIEHIEIVSWEQYRGLVAQILREAPSTTAINKRVKKGEAQRFVVLSALPTLGLPISIRLYFFLEHVDVRCSSEFHVPCPGGGWLVNFVNNSEYTSFFIFFLPAFLVGSFVIGLVSTYFFFRALKAWANP